MKKILIGLMTLSSLSVFAAPQLDCAIKAQEKLLDLSNNSIATLCSGAESIAPVNCALKAKQILNFSNNAIVSLCSGTTSSAPVDCAIEASNNTQISLNVYSIANLCGKPIVLNHN
jgi:hypothetical protein